MPVTEMMRRIVDSEEDEGKGVVDVTSSFQWVDVMKHGVFMVFSWCFHGVFMVCSWCFHGVSSSNMIMSWDLLVCYHQTW